MSRTTQRKFLVLVLVGILGVCVGVAWYMTVRIDAPTHQGTEIMQDIRVRKLLSFWGEQKTYHQHYLVYQRVGGKLVLVGWRFKYRGLNSDPRKGFVGGDISWKGGTTRSSWTLTNGLDKGTYESNFMRVVEGKYVPIMLASIELDGGNLQVQQNLKGQELSTVSEIPDNYIPEGTLSLVYREVANRKTHAKFKMIFDNLAPVGGKPRFGAVGVRYLHPPKDDPAGSVLEVKHIVLGSVATDQVVLDADGNIVGENGEGMVVAPVSAQEFAMVFPIHARSLNGLAMTYPNITNPDTVPKVTVDGQGDTPGGE